MTFLRVAAQVGGALLVLLAGALTAVATALLHHTWWGLAWGVLAAVIAVWALPTRWWGRFSFVAAWIAATLVVLSGRPEGDFLVADTLPGYLYLGTGLLLVLVAASGGTGRRTRARAARRQRPNVASGGAPSYTR